MRDAFFPAWELNVCTKFQIHSSKTVAAPFRTSRQKGEKGETRGKPKYVAKHRSGRYTVHGASV